MPTIAEFKAPELGLRPSEVGITATAAAARRVTGAYSQAAGAMAGVGHEIAGALTSAMDVAVTSMEHGEITHGAQAWAGLSTQLTENYKDHSDKADPNDPLSAKGWLQDTLEPALQKFKSGFLTQKGQEFAEQHIDQFREHMWKTAQADRAKHAGAATTNALSSSRNSLDNGLINDPTPENLENARKSWTTTVTGLTSTSPSIDDPTKRSKAHNDLIEEGMGGFVKSSALGGVLRDGKVPEWITQDPKYNKYIPAEERIQLETKARTSEKFLTQQQNVANKQILQVQLNALEHNLNDIRTESRPDTDLGPRKMPTDVWKRLDQLTISPGADSPQGAKMIAAADSYYRSIAAQLNKPPPKQDISTPTWADLHRRINSQDADRLTDESAINDAYGQGLLTPHDHDSLLKEFEDLKNPTGQRISQLEKNLYAGIKKQIDHSNPAMGNDDPEGAKQFARFTQDVHNMVEEYRASGRNPFDLFDSTKPDYLGSEAKLRAGGYLKTMSETTADISRRLNPPPTGAPAALPPKPLTFSAPEGLTQQERNLLDYSRDNMRKGTYATMPNGDIASVYITGVEGPGARIYNVPGYWNGQLHTDIAEIQEHAKTIGWSKFPSYATPNEADVAAEKVHKIIESDTELFRRGQPSAPGPAQEQRATGTPTPVTTITVRPPPVPSAPIGTPQPNFRADPNEDPADYLRRRRGQTPAAPPSVPFNPKTQT
jgi:hypothetical protein